MTNRPVLFFILATLAGLSIGLACFADDDDDDDNDNDDHDSDQDNDDEDDDDSSSSADDDNGGDDDDTVPYCDDHQGNLWEPALLNATLMVNGIAVEMPATVNLSDSLTVAIEYEDPDCNLIGGRIVIHPNYYETYRDEMQEIIQGVYILDEIGCSSIEEGEPFILQLDPNNYYFPPPITRSYPFEMNMSDICLNINDKTETQYLDFTVVEYYRAD